MHGIDDNLPDKIKIGQARQLREPCGVLLHKWCARMICR